MTGKYQSFTELEKNEIEGKDYQIRKRYGPSGIAVMAPHGGGIEPGTTEIADAVSGSEHTFYTFSGLKKQGNAALHITSRQFDEPQGNQIVADAKTVLTIHGFKGNEKLVYIGGRDKRLKACLRKALIEANFIVREIKRYPGENPY
ncbi:MAG: poly-gamma-glutamate hydrolase family protein, partial [Proteobacteria bacterium]|nr:poly-gamma-glutamate hydrolase family protein [Pseudomonadota bacterium]